MKRLSPEFTAGYSARDEQRGVPVHPNAEIARVHDVVAELARLDQVEEAVTTANVAVGADQNPVVGHIASDLIGVVRHHCTIPLRRNPLQFLFGRFVHAACSQCSVLALSRCATGLSSRASVASVGIYLHFTIASHWQTRADPDAS